MQQDGQHGAVHAAGDAADHLLVAHAFPDFPDELPFEVADIEFLEVGGAGEEVAQDGAPFMGMGHFRMELDAESCFSPLEGDGDAFCVAGDHLAAFRQVVHRIRMAHPYLGGGGHVPVQARAGFRKQGGGAVFPLVAGLDGTAVLDVQQLHAVAHAQDGDVQAFEPFKVNIRGVCGAFGASGKDDGAGFVNLVQVFQRVQFGHVAQFAHAAHNELGVLGAEVNDGYEVLVVHVREGLTGIVDGFFRDGDVVGMAFLQAA